MLWGNQPVDHQDINHTGGHYYYREGTCHNPNCNNGRFVPVESCRTVKVALTGWVEQVVVCSCGQIYVAEYDADAGVVETSEESEEDMTRHNKEYLYDNRN